MQLNTQVEVNSAVLSVPHPEGSTKPVSPKIEQLVTSISQLNLLEVAELSEVLKKRLNLPDAPVMPMGFAAPAAAAEVSVQYLFLCYI